MIRDEGCVLDHSSLSVGCPVCYSQPSKSAKTVAESSEPREMQQVEDRWADDHQARSVCLGAGSAPQFIGISVSGDVVTRNQQIAHLFVKNEGTQSLEQKVVSVRLVGDVAIVNEFTS